MSIRAHIDVFYPHCGPLRKGVASALVALFAVACFEAPTNGDRPGTSPATVDAQCVADGECPGDETCIRGLCSVAVVDTLLPYGAEVRPPNSSPVAQQRFSIADRPSTDAELVADNPEAIDGEITTDAAEPAPAGTLVIEPTDSNQASSTTVQHPVRNGVFDLQVAPGDYALTYIVDDERWPRLDLGVFDLSSADPSLDLQIPEFSQLRVVTGELTRDAIELVGIGSEPVEDAEVVAHSAATDRRSQVDVTDEHGQFRLHLPPGDDEFDVLVRPTPDNRIVPRASFVGEIDAATDDISISVGALDLDLSLLSLDLGAEAVDDQSPDWRDVRVEIHRPVDVGELVVTPEIADDGSVDIELPVGSYEIEITPPSNSAWSSATRQVDLLDGLLSVDIELPARQRVEGRIFDQNGDALASVRVDITALDSQPTADRPVYTDEEGRFVVWLDPGDFRASFRPPASLALPRIYRGFTVETGGTGELDVEIPRGFVATGRIVTAGDNPVGYTTVKALGTDADTDERIIATSQTDSDGVYRLVLPPSFLD